MFYTLINSDKKGPFNKEDLLDHLVSRNTLVWKESMDEWVKVKDIPELSQITNQIPPEPPTIKSKINTKKLITVTILFSFLSVLFYLILGGYALGELEITYEYYTYIPDTSNNRTIKDEKLKTRRWKVRDKEGNMIIPVFNEHYIIEDQMYYQLKHQDKVQDYMKHFLLLGVPIYSQQDIIRLQTAPSTKLFTSLNERLIIISLSLNFIILMLWYYRHKIFSLQLYNDE